MVVSYLRSIFLKSKMRNTRSTQHQADEECCEHQESGSHRTTELFNVLLTQNPADETDLNNNHELSTLSSIPDNSTIEYPSSFVYSDQTVSSRHISSVPPLIESDALLSDNPTVVRNTVSRFGSTFSTRLMVSMTIAVSIAVFIVITTVALVPGISKKVVDHVIIGMMFIATFYFILVFLGQVIYNKYNKV